MPQIFHCPNCNAPLDYDGGQNFIVKCVHCNSSVVVPEDLRPPKPEPIQINLTFNPAQSPAGAPPQTPAGSFAKLIHNFGGPGIGPGLFNDARQIAIDGAGFIYIGDYTGGRIQRFNPEGKFAAMWLVDAKAPLTGLAADRGGKVYAIQRGTITRFDGNSGEKLGEIAYGEGWGFQHLTPTAEGGLLTSWYKNRDDIVRFDWQGQPNLTIRAALSSITEDSELDTHVAADGLGNIYALGKFHNAVFKFNRSGKFVNRFGSDGDEPGQFRAPSTIAVDGQGRAYVGDFKGIQVFDMEGRYLGRIGVSGPASGLAFDGQGFLWVVARTKGVQVRNNRWQIVRTMRLTKILFWLTPPALSLALYGSTLSLPFFWDDIPNFQFLFGRPITEILAASPNFPYYRPLTFVIWRVMQLAFGATNTGPFHALNILMLAACGWAVGGLALKLSDNDSAAWLAGLLMTVFPFTALVVPLVASLFHLFVTLINVAACLCLLEYDRTQRTGWAVVAIGLAALAPFAHESGMVAAVLMGICLSAHWLLNRLRPARALAVAGLALVCNLAFIPWWVNVPKDRPEGAFAWVGWEFLGQSLVFFLEGLTFPIQFLARPLIQLGFSDMMAVIVLGLALLTLALVVLRRRLWLLFGLAFCYAAAAPAIIALPFAYVIVSPRLMVVAAPAAAILWALVAVEASERLKREKIRPVAAALAVLAASLVPVWHIVKEVRLHHLALDPLWSFVEALKADPGSKHLVVNATNWIAPVQATYALGHEGVEVMPGYITPQLMAWVHTQILYDVDGVTFPLVFPQLNNIYFATWGEAQDWNAMAERIRGTDAVALVSYSDEVVIFRPVGRVSFARSPGSIKFADRIELAYADPRVTDQTIELGLTWQVKVSSGEDIFANALDCNGNVLGLSGGASLGGLYPIWLWQPGEVITEARRIPLEASSPDGCYRVELGLFDPNSGARTEAQALDGSRLDNDVVVLQWTEPGR